MSHDEHVELLDVLSDIKGKFILSGYLSDLYLEAEKMMGWRREEREVVKHSSSKSNKAKATECLWMNF
jgi:site-specific DNA-adenine methylase